MYLATAFGEFKTAPVVLDSEDISSDSVEIVICPFYEKFLDDDGIVVHSFVSSFLVIREIDNDTIPICLGSWPISMSSLSYPDSVFK